MTRRMKVRARVRTGKVHPAASHYVECPNCGVISEPKPTAIMRSQTSPYMSLVRAHAVATRHARLCAAFTVPATVTRLHDGWVPFGWHAAMPMRGILLDFDGEDDDGMPLWERNKKWRA